MLMAYKGTSPKLHENSYLAPTSVVIGDVEAGEGFSVWFNTVIRGDVNTIRIGKRVNVQDLSILHVTGKTHPLIIGDDVSVGHSVTLHGCTIGKMTLIGMGATVLDGAEIGEFSIVAAGALVPEGAKYPPRSLIMGIPGRRVREVTEEEIERIACTRDAYLAHAEEYRAG